MNSLLLSALLAASLGSLPRAEHYPTPTSLASLGAAGDDFAGLDETISELLESWDIPGLAIGVVRDGEIVYLRGFGVVSREQGTGVTPSTLFAIGSVSKPITSLSAAVLVEEGELDLDRPVNEYLPDFRLSDEYASLHTTPRDLLCHRTGLPGHARMVSATNHSRSELVARLRYLQPSAGFRETYQYNNLTYIALGELVGRVSARTWEEFARDRIFEPLGMGNTGFAFPSATSGEVALPHARRDGRLVPLVLPRRSVSNPAAGVISNAEELLSWLRLYLDSGELNGQRLVSEELIQEMFTPQMPIRYVPEDLLGPLEAYGLGWTIRPYRGRSLVHHGGWIDGYVSWVSMMPEEGIGVVVLSNRGGQLLPLYLNYHVYHRLLGLDRDWTLAVQPDDDATEANVPEQMESGPESGSSPPPSHRLEEYAGLYRHPAYGEVTLEEEGGLLQLTFNDKVTTVLRHVRYNTFVTQHDQPDFSGLRAHFPVSWLGRIDSVSIPMQAEVEGRVVDDIVFRRIADESLRNEGFLRQFAGTYDYQGVLVRVQVRGGDSLIAIVPGEPESVLDPFAASVFTFKGKAQWRLEFERDRSGRVTTAILHRPEGSLRCVRVE